VLSAGKKYIEKLAQEEELIENRGKLHTGG